MAEPVYIVCSESGAIDHRRNSVSIFHVLDTIMFGEITPSTDIKQIPSGSKPWLELRVTAVWRRNDEEAGEAFEHQTTFSVPGDDQKRIIGEGSFVFKSPLHRFITDFGGPTINQEGILRIENKVRKLGDDDWKIQAYEIRVEKVKLIEKPSQSKD